MTVYAALVGYLALHFVVYASIGRKKRYLRREKGIFIFHAASFTAVLVIVASYAWFSDLTRDIALILGAAALHGIYSLSFLELWSLSQISYSRDVIEAVLEGHRAQSDVVAALVSTGNRKKVSRLEDLEKLGLLHTHTKDGTVHLSGVGRALSEGLRALRWLTNLKITG